MTRSLDEYWDAALKIASRQLASPSLNWLKDTKPESLKDNVLTISVPSDFAKNWIESHYREELLSSWREAYGKASDIKFTVSVQGKAVPGALFPMDVQMTPIRKRKPVEDTSQYIKGLNPRYSFENFIVGASNRFAHAAAYAVSENPAKTYNPLFLYGGVGLGKTHLMQAIAHYVLGHHKNLRVSYVSSETFTNELILAIQEGNTQDFRNRYRG